MNGKEKGNVKGIFGIIMICCFLIYEIVSGVTVLCAYFNRKTIDMESNMSMQRGQFVELKIQYASPEYAEVNHSVNFIPTGKEHYFLVFNNSCDHCISIRTNKEFYDSQFEDLEATSINGVTVRGYVKKMDSEVSSRMNTVISDMRQYVDTLEGNRDIFIDTNAIPLAIMDLFLGLAPVVLGSWIWWSNKRAKEFGTENRFRDDNNKATPGAYILLVGILLYAILMIYCLMMK